jgi:hypothetical protein
MANAPGHALIDAGDVLLVAADPIDDSAGMTLNCLDCASPRSVWMPGRSRPGDGLVGIALDQLRALALRVLSAQPELVLAIEASRCLSED